MKAVVWVGGTKENNGRLAFDLPAGIFYEKQTEQNLVSVQT